MSYAEAIELLAANPGLRGVVDITEAWVSDATDIFGNVRKAFHPPGKVEVDYLRRAGRGPQPGGDIGQPDFWKAMGFKDADAQTIARVVNAHRRADAKRRQLEDE